MAHEIRQLPRATLTKEDLWVPRRPLFGSVLSTTFLCTAGVLGRFLSTSLGLLREIWVSLVRIRWFSRSISLSRSAEKEQAIGLGCTRPPEQGGHTHGSC